MSSGATRFSATTGGAPGLSTARARARTNCGECGRLPVTKGSPKSGPTWLGLGLGLGWGFGLGLGFGLGVL